MYMDNEVSDKEDCDSEYQCDSDSDTDEEEMYLEEMCLLCDPKRNMRALKQLQKQSKLETHPPKSKEKLQEEYDK